MDDEAIDRIFAGKLENLPPVSSKIVRIFTSSTFTDTSTERNTLMEEVYPKLKEYCREKHGLEFQVVDMRWGVRDEATDDHMTTELCMKEIDNCQRLSMGPNFVKRNIEHDDQQEEHSISSTVVIPQQSHGTMHGLLYDAMHHEALFYQSHDTIPGQSHRTSRLQVDGVPKRNIEHDDQQEEHSISSTVVIPQQSHGTMHGLLYDAMHHEALFYQSHDTIPGQSHRTSRLQVDGVPVFLGQKYGYRPIPTYILSSELAMMRDALVATNTDVSILDKWYKKDANAVPPVSILQPISSILVNFINKRVPKLQAQDQATWWDTLGKMQKLFRKAALILYNENKMDKDAMHNYYMSVTEREVIRGILNVKNTKNHILAYVRYINNINLSNLKSASKFIDIINRNVDTEACELLADLRDNRLQAKIEPSNLCKFTVEWIGKEGLELDTHREYIQQFITHFYKNITKLVDRAMRKEDSSPQGQIVTEILQHLHACNNSVKVFHGRNQELARVENYILGNVDKPLLLYSTGGCGKTSMIAKAASMVAKWLPESKPVIVVRFVGTTPDSSALAPLLTSMSKQIAYNYMLPMEGIPEDLVPLTAHLKSILNHATREQPLIIFLDSVDQISGIEQSNKLSWIPVSLAPNVKFVLSCNEDDQSSQDLVTLQNMIDCPDNYLEVSPLGEELATNVIKLWMEAAHRDLNNYQWRIVQSVLSKCTLPIFVKLVFAEICRWKSYSRPQETQLASTVNDSIMKLFDRIELQHGKLLVFHALAYITASKSGLSESELEDLISLDDKVLDDVYQYHLPPVRRIPPLLWTRIRNDLPNYLSEREADGVSVMNWYHRQFKEAAKERYFKNLNMAYYFHSMIADYFMGIWGGGQPKPFRFTEVQRHRFGLAEKEGEADRKVPLQPLVFYNKDGKVARYNLRKFGELPYHLVRSRRFDDLFEHILFNYEWLHAKLSSCPLQAVLNDFEDAYQHCEDNEAKREILLVADAMRLGGAIISEYPDMLAPQLLGRLLPEMNQNKHVRLLLQQCDGLGPQHCALLPTYHSLHTPGGPLKYSLEGHNFAVFAFCLTSDKRYVVSVSNRIIMWDLSTSDITRNINPEVEGIMQALVVSPDNRKAISYTSNNQIVLANILTGEAKVISQGLQGDDAVLGVDVSDTHWVVWGKRQWSLWDVGGKFVENHRTVAGRSILSMDFTSVGHYDVVYCKDSGGGEEQDEEEEEEEEEPTTMWLNTVVDGTNLEPLNFCGVMVKNDRGDLVYACSEKKGSPTLSVFRRQESCWAHERDVGEVSERILQLRLWEKEGFLLATVMLGFQAWRMDEVASPTVYRLPHSVRNIPMKPMQSNTAAISRNNAYVVAGVRKVLYVWDLEKGDLLKCLDAHFARIIHLAPLIDDLWNSVVTSSIDRTVKVWNIDNIFEKVHVIDRHEMPVDSVSLSSRTNRIVTVTRSCVGVWNLRTGRLLCKLADSPLGAIVTHAAVTRNGRYIAAIESDHLIVWDADQETQVSKSEQKSVKQLLLMDEDTKALCVSRDVDGKCRCVARVVPDGEFLYEFEYVPKVFRPVAVTADGNYAVALASERTKDCVLVYHVQTGMLQQKITPKYPKMKEIVDVVALPHKFSQIALIDPDKGNIIDIKSKKFNRSVPRWNGKCTKDGKYGLYAPSRGGLELIELRYGNTVKTFLPRVAEGVFTVSVMFTKHDDYVLYYHSGRQTIRVFRVSDAVMIANYKVQADLNAIECADDGTSLVLGTVDGCVTGLLIVDPNRPDAQQYVAAMPSRMDRSSQRADGPIINFKTTAHITTMAVGTKSMDQDNIESKTCCVQ